MSLYEGAKKSQNGLWVVRELEIKADMHQGPVLSPVFFAAAVDVVTKFARECTK